MYLKKKDDLLWLYAKKKMEKCWFIYIVSVNKKRIVNCFLFINVLVDLYFMRFDNEIRRKEKK